MAAEQERAQALRFVQEMAGWQLIEQHILERAADHREQLMTCKDWESVLQHRAGAEALEAVLLFIDQTIRDGEEQ
ncbi:hypothetical protein GXP70_12415 [Paenibacillus lycopersici]|uniref:Uncharacterized protein n=1 Tax=Paenibacillus lycopersici TaxID=2704462 RepID=A0A6C0FZL7_9BACL|nr:hypothetical protein [Paenibacillus lycopersici]QHT60664.1 hypothetical protein GXP70_12415 [Paenibacillus lycopersici]